MEPQVMAHWFPRGRFIVNIKILSKRTMRLPVTDGIKITETQTTDITEVLEMPPVNHLYITKKQKREQSL